MPFEKFRRLASPIRASHRVSFTAIKPLTGALPFCDSPSMPTGFQFKISFGRNIDSMPIVGWISVFGLLMVAGCSGRQDSGSAADTGSVVSAGGDLPQLIRAEHLPNLVRLHDKVISGGLPGDEAAFRELQALGIRTVISVDGAKPDVELARKFGMRYVHLPHGYDGIPEQRVNELASAVRELDGPIYIHCHHGKHRSPAAAAVACVSTGMIDVGQAQAVLKLAGTNPNYLGLYQSVSSARQIDNATLDNFDFQFQEVSEIPPMAEAMVEIERVFSQLKQIAAAGWRSPTKHPDLEPAHEALMLREHFSEMLRAAYISETDQDFRELLKSSELLAKGLESDLRQWKRDSTNVNHVDSEARKEFDKRIMQIETGCTDCHQRFRD